MNKHEIRIARTAMLEASYLVMRQAQYSKKLAGEMETEEGKRRALIRAKGFEALAKRITKLMNEKYPL